MKKNKKILVTGANGFVGSHMLDYLLSKKKYKIYGLIKINAQKRNIKHLLNKVDFIEGDVTDRVSTDVIIKKLKPEYIYHFAALSWVSPSWNMPSAYFNVNALGTINLLESVRKYNINSKILISCTPEEFGDVKKKIVSISSRLLLNKAIFFSNSKSAGFLSPLTICLMFLVLQNSAVKPSYFSTKTRGFLLNSEEMKFNL